MTLWTDEQDAMIANLYGTMSFAVIVAELNAKFGTSFSRSAVIGRTFRLGLSKGKKKIPLSTARKAKGTVGSLAVGVITRIKRTKMKEATAGDGYKLKTVEIVSLDIPLVEFEPHHCRFACNEADGKWLFCGHPRRTGSSYCEAHHSLCWNKPSVATMQKPHYRRAA